MRFDKIVREHSEVNINLPLLEVKYRKRVEYRILHINGKIVKFQWNKIFHGLKL